MQKSELMEDTRRTRFLDQLSKAHMNSQKLKLQAENKHSSLLGPRRMSLSFLSGMDGTSNCMNERISDSCVCSWAHFLCLRCVVQLQSVDFALSYYIYFDVFYCSLGSLF